MFGILDDATYRIRGDRLTIELAEGERGHRRFRAARVRQRSIALNAVPRCLPTWCSCRGGSWAGACARRPHDRLGGREIVQGEWSAMCDV